MPFRRGRGSLDRLLRRHPALRAAVGRVLSKKLERPETVPFELTGKWVAWTADGLRIVAHGETATAARDAALLAGVRDPVCEWIPRAEELRSLPREVTPQP